MTRVLTLVVLLLNATNAWALDPFAQARIEQRPGASISLDTVFRDEAGHELTLRQAAGGKPMLLAPVMHRCPNICGLTLAGVAEAVQLQKFVSGRDFALVAFGLDPREGTTEAALSIDGLRKNFSTLQAGVHGLTGNEADIEAVLKPLGYRYAWDENLNQYAHIAAVAVLTPDGRLSRWLYGITPDPNDVRLALTEAGEGKIGTWSDQLLLLCYHYDPQTGRYGSVIWILLRLAGALTVVMGAGWIGWMILRERRRAERASP